MFNVGIASSIARKQDYSWEYTIDFCARHNLRLIQFYWQNPIPRIKKLETLDIPQRYLHLPVKADITMSFPEFSALCADFSEYYKSNNLIMHQQRAPIIDGVDAKLISQLNELQFRLGLENDDSKSLTGFQSGLDFCCRRNFRIFTVFDIHKFFHRFYRTHTVEQIVQACADTLLYCRKLNLTMLLHIIDSHSFDAGRDSWCPVFDGVIPYRQIFELIKTSQVCCEGIILEYEDELMAAESLRRLNEMSI
jgi:hypothetical protein